MIYARYLYIFFQAEDGIRVYKVTGVQTCALPISFTMATIAGWIALSDGLIDRHGKPIGTDFSNVYAAEIGRASCRERVEISVVALKLKKRHYVSRVLSIDDTEENTGD